MLLSLYIKRLELWNWHETRHLPVAAQCDENHHLGSTRILIPVKIIRLKINGAPCQTTSSHQDGTLRMRLAHTCRRHTCGKLPWELYAMAYLDIMGVCLLVTASGFAKLSRHLKCCFVKVLCHIFFLLHRCTCLRLFAILIFLSIFPSFHMCRKPVQIFLWTGDSSFSYTLPLNPTWFIPGVKCQIRENSKSLSLLSVWNKLLCPYTNLLALWND